MDRVLTYKTLIYLLNLEFGDIWRIIESLVKNFLATESVKGIIHGTWKSEIQGHCLVLVGLKGVHAKQEREWNGPDVGSGLKGLRPFYEEGSPPWGEKNISPLASCLVGSSCLLCGEGVLDNLTKEK